MIHTDGKPTIAHHPDTWRDDPEHSQLEDTTNDGQETPAKFNLVGALTDYEQGEMTMEQVLELFSHLVKTGLAWQLQGHYGRVAAGLIDAGWFDADGNILDRGEAA